MNNTVKCAVMSLLWALLKDKANVCEWGVRMIEVQLNVVITNKTQKSNILRTP